jgi:hypothetical protein
MDFLKVVVLYLAFPVRLPKNFKGRQNRKDKYKIININTHINEVSCSTEGIPIVKTQIGKKF